MFLSFSQTRLITVEKVKQNQMLDWKISKMTRQFRCEKWSKNGHILGKILHCVPKWQKCWKILLDKWTKNITYQKKEIGFVFCHTVHFLCLYWRLKASRPSFHCWESSQTHTSPPLFFSLLREEIALTNTYYNRAQRRLRFP